MSSLKVEVIVDLPSLERLRAEWNDLVDEMEIPEIFYCWEWNYHFFRRYRAGDSLYVLVVRQPSGKLAGIAPLCIRHARHMLRPVRVVETIVVNIGDYRNILVHKALHRSSVV